MSSATLSAPAPAESPALLDVKAVAARLDVSTRTVYRLADAGQMPKPRRLGVLVRWSVAELDEWIAGGCKPVRAPARPLKRNSA